MNITIPTLHKRLVANIYRSCAVVAHFYRVVFKKSIINHSREIISFSFSIHQNKHKQKYEAFGLNRSYINIIRNAQLT